MIRRINLAALTRVEFSAPVVMPDGCDEDDVSDIVDQLYEDIDGGDYFDDPDYWERGTCTTTEMSESETDDAARHYTAEQKDGQWVLTQQEGPPPTPTHNHPDCGIDGKICGECYERGIDGKIIDGTLPLARNRKEST